MEGTNIVDHRSQVDLHTFAEVARQRIANNAVRDAEVAAMLQSALNENTRLQQENDQLRRLLKALQTAVEDAGLNVEDTNAISNG